MAHPSSRILERALALSPNDRSRAHATAWLALLESRLDHGDRAAAFLRESRELDPSCYSLEFVERAWDAPSAARS